MTDLDYFSVQPDMPVGKKKALPRAYAYVPARGLGRVFRPTQKVNLLGNMVLPIYHPRLVPWGYCKTATMSMAKHSYLERNQKLAVKVCKAMGWKDTEKEQRQRRMDAYHDASNHNRVPDAAQV